MKEVKSIFISRRDGNRFNLRAGNLIGEELSFEEMIGMVISAFSPIDRGLPYLRTKEAIAEMKKASAERALESRKGWLENDVESLCAYLGISRVELSLKSRKRPIVERKAIVTIILTERGYSSTEIAPYLGVNSSTARYYNQYLSHLLKDEAMKLMNIIWELPPMI